MIGLWIAVAQVIRLMTSLSSVVYNLTTHPWVMYFLSSSSQQTIIQNVLHVPRLSADLLSVSRIIE